MNYRRSTPTAAAHRRLLLRITIGVATIVGSVFLIKAVKGIDGAPLHPNVVLAEDPAANAEPPLLHSAPRIATLQAFAADQLIAMGVTPVCVPGLRSETPDAWLGIPTIQMDHSAGPSLEQLIAVDPDIIVTGRVYAQFMPHIQEVTNAEVVYIDVESIDNIWTHLQTLGELARCPDAATKRCAAIQASVQ